MHQHGTIYRFLQNAGKYSSVNLHISNFHHHIFFDQMQIGSKLGWSPEIRMGFSYKPNTKKIIFDKVNYFDIVKPPFELKKEDQLQIFQKFRMLYNHHRFIPKTPFLGFLENDEMKDWFIWSYTPIEIIDNQNQFMEGLYRHGYNVNPLLQKIVVDPMCEWDYQKNKNRF
jgi:hypothetical protein